MSLCIRGDWIESGAFHPSPNHGTPILPRAIVLHYTGTWDAPSAIRILSDAARPARVSAHVVVATDGATTQLVSFGTAAWHAGRAELTLSDGPTRDVNAHAIGIEIVNPGFLRRSADGVFTDHSGTDVTAFVQHGPPLVSTPWPLVGPGDFYWVPYTEPQLKAVDDLSRALLQAYPGIERIVGHSEISPHKSDPGPIFPLERFKRLLNEPPR